MRRNAGLKHVISVTSKEIERGVKGSPRYCPVALAFRNKGWGVYTVAGEYAKIYVDDNLGMVELPSDAQWFINDFDADKPVEPFEFELDVYWAQDRDLKRD